jgi:hypothetical protein
MHILILIRTLAATLLALAATNAVAQPAAPELIPANPSSADTVVLKIPRGCSNSNYEFSTYHVNNVNGRIRVNLLLKPPPPCPLGGPAVPALLVELGRLPAGTYLIDIVEAYRVSFEALFINVVTGMPLTVSDHRASKTAPAVRLNYSDHWWDPANAGSGVFIWHDARDQLLAAWFSYAPDGKSTWYTLQAGAWVTATRYEGKLVQTSRAPGAGVDAAGATAVQLVGSAALDFGSDDGALAGVFSVTFDGQPTQNRSIRRFGK